MVGLVPCESWAVNDLCLGNRMKAFAASDWFVVSMGCSLEGWLRLCVSPTLFPARASLSYAGDCSTHLVERCP